MNKTLLLISIIGLLLTTGCVEKKEYIKAPILRTTKANRSSFNVSMKFEEAIGFQNQRNYAKAIEIYNSIINYYRNREDKRALAGVYINKFECSLLTNRGYSKRDVEDFLRRFGNNPREMMSFEVLYILDGAKTQSMDGEIEQWTSKYRGQRMSEWTFKYIDDWIKRMENTRVRNRLNRYVSIFKRFL